ncbi:MAG: polymerase sigma-32 factor [Acetobacteraceae bacterium]|nr:polymerase sigma-32 factor [Acetobacteraceae bacterium]
MASAVLNTGPECEIHKSPLLAPEEELALARRWRECQHTEAAHGSVIPHLRLVAKIAKGYRGYDLSMGKLIGEGNISLMQTVTWFDPDRGFRLATFAMRWIRDAVQHVGETAAAIRHIP